jgi:hypothetical protein
MVHRVTSRSPDPTPARTKPHFIEIPRRSSVPFTEEQLNSIRGGLTAEEYRWKLIREFLER